MPANPLAACLDAALVVSGGRTSEARLDEIVVREREEPRRENTLAADEDLRHRSLQVVVRDPMRHRAEMLERAHVPVEEARLILPRV
ncbi:hypothetical protein D3C83_124310 [compost metagenome]